jgi:hypothetical protein
MKKQLLNLGVAFAATLFLAGGALAQHEAPIQETTVPYVTDAIVIDGTADEESWSTAEAITGKFNIAGVTSDADFSGTLQTCWDDNNLYIFIDIKDDVETAYTGTGDTYTFDCVEFFQDIDTLSPTPATGAYSGDDIQGRFNRSWDTYTGTAGRNDAEYEYAYNSGGTGWTVEGKLPWVAVLPEGSVPEDINAWVEKALGFDIQIADNDGSGRDGQFAWDPDDLLNGTTEDNAWKDTRVFGVIHLGEKPAIGVAPVQNTQFGVYPNPATSEVNFSNLNGVTSIELVNLIGQTVMTVDVNGYDVNLNVSDLASGTYFAKIYTSNGIATEQILIK